MVIILTIHCQLEMTTAYSTSCVGNVCGLLGLSPSLRLGFTLCNASLFALFVCVTIQFTN